MTEQYLQSNFLLLLNCKHRRKWYHPPPFYHEKLIAKAGLDDPGWQDKILEVKEIEIEYLWMLFHGGFEFISKAPLSWVCRKPYKAKNYNQKTITKFSKLGKQKYLEEYNVSQFNKLKKYEKYVLAPGRREHFDNYDRWLLQKWKNAYIHWFLQNDVHLPANHSEHEVPLTESQPASDKRLAEVYLKCIIETGKPSPSQTILSQKSSVSQSTWSRKFKSKEFWGVVHKEMELLLNQNDNLIQAQLVVKDQLERLRSKSLQHVTKSISQNADSLSSDDLSEFDEVEQAVDANLLKQLSDNELCQEIIGIDPQYSMANLQKLTRAHLEVLFKGLN